MDDHTGRHFETWLERQFSELARDTARERMLVLYETDPAYWQDKGWSELATHSRAWASAAYVGEPCRCVMGLHWSPERGGYYHCAGVVGEA